MQPFKERERERAITRGSAVSYRAAEWMWLLVNMRKECAWITVDASSDLSRVLVSPSS